MTDNADDPPRRTGGSFVPIGSVVFVALMLVLVVVAWVGMYLLLLHRGGVP